MIGVTRRMHDLSGNSHLAKDLTALLERDDDVALSGNLDVMVAWFRPNLHEWDCVNLNIEDEKGNALPFQFLGQAGMVRVIVGGKCVADFVEGRAHPLEVRLHRSEGARPADINQQPRRARAHNPIVGRAVTDVNNRHRCYSGHRSSAAASLLNPWRQIDNSELLKHAKLVETIPALGQLAPLDTSEEHSVELHLFARRRET
jgi:hypothetical protein